MSTQEKSSTPWADRLFDRMTRIYGAQKVASMWARPGGGGSKEEEQRAQDAHIDAIRAEWEQQLRRFDKVTLQRTLQELIDNGDAWPPSLPAFVKLARGFAPSAAHTIVALPDKPREINPEAMAQVAKQVKSAFDTDADSLAWARAPKSAITVRLMAESKDGRVQTALQALISTGGEGCRDEAKKAIARLTR